MSLQDVQPLARREAVGHTIEMILIPRALGIVVIMDTAVPVATMIRMVDHRHPLLPPRGLIIIHLTIHLLIIDIIHILPIMHLHLTTVQIVTLKDQVTSHQEVT